MILWKFTLREISNRPGRATLTLLSIILGVAAVVAVTVCTATTNQACREMYLALAGRAALEVAAEGGGFFDERLAETIAQTPDVKAVVPSVQKLSSLRFEGRRVGLLAMGIDPEQDKAVRDYELEAGSFFSKKHEALLESGFARGLGIQLGDEVKLAVSRGGLSGNMTVFRIVGLLAPRGAASFNQGGVIFLPLRTAQNLFARPGQVDTLSIVLTEGADEKAVAEELARRLPPGLSVRSPLARSQLSKETVEKVEKGLDFAYVAMLALAFFMILNTFLMNIGERRRQLAILRAIGATRRQIIRMLLGEGLAMGIVGTIIGIGAGLGGAWLLTRSMGQFYATAMPALRITPLPFIVAGLVGPLVSLFAMFAPAWLAAKVSPLEGMRYIVSEVHHRTSPAYVFLAVSVFIITGSVMAACIVGYLPIRWMIIAGVVFTAAFVLLIPIVLGVFSRVLAFLLRPFLRTEGFIAHRQILRRRVRTTLTIGILYIAVSTAVSLGTTILNNVEDIHTWVATALKGDFFVRALKQDTATGLSAKMPESLVEELRAVPGVINVDSLRYLSGSIRTPLAEDGKQQVMIFVRDFTDRGNLPLMIKDGDPTQVRRRLADGEVVLGTVLANRLGIGVDEEITLETRQGPTSLRVAATTTAYMVGGMIVYMEGATARRLLNVEGVDMYVLNVAPQALDEVAGKLKAICERDGLMVHSFAELRRHVDRLTAGVIAGLWALLALGLVVGAFGIANTLTMNVLEQTRELALLRVVAMTRRQVRKTIFSQAAIIGLIGLLTGLGGGLIGAYVINLTSIPLLGYAPAFSLHPSLLVVCFGVGMAVILLAAWLPAERAARLNLLIALQYE